MKALIVNTIKEILSLDASFEVKSSLKLGEDLHFESIDFLDLFVELENKTNKKLSPKECLEYFKKMRPTDSLKDITVEEIVKYVESV